MIYITTADLKGACSGQVELFNDKFKGKAKITHRNMAKAIAAGLDVFWLECLIPAAAWAEYGKVRAKALVAALTGQDSEGGGHG